MNRTNLLKDFSNKIFKYRESFGYSKKKMAAFFGVSTVNYTRYEEAIIFPNFWGLYYFASKTGISMDWLVCNKGPMYFEEKIEAEKEKKEVKEETEVKEEIVETPPPEVKEAKPEPGREMMDAEIIDLVDHMERIPLLRHEILASFYKFKDKNKKMVEEAGTE